MRGRWLLACGVLFGCWACGASGSSGAQLRAGQADEASWGELAALLPGGADECVLARPSALAAGLGEIYGPISRAENWIWPREARIAAYARAGWHSAGHKRWLILLRFEGPAAELRAWVDREAGLELVWEDAAAVSCDAERCPILASFIDARTLRLVQGAIPAQITARAPLSVCAELVARHPRAIELSRRRADTPALGTVLGVPLETRAWTMAGASSAAFQRIETMNDEDTAQRALERDACRELWGGGITELDAQCERTRDGLELRTSARVRWEDLRLRRDDALRHARARRYADALERVRADDAVALDDLADVWRELGVRRTLLDTSGADPRAGALTLLRFLGRALERHPDEPRLRALRRELMSRAQVTGADMPAMTPP